MPKCSILLGYYNDKDFLNQSIDSVLNQTFTDFELILINHATQDNCRDIAHSYKDERIRHIDMSHNICGLGSEVFLKFLDEATGEYVKFFSADDIMLPNCLEILVETLERDKSIDIVAANMSDIDEHGKTIVVIDDYLKLTRGKDRFKLLLGLLNFITPFCYPTVLVRRNIIDKKYIDRTGLVTFDVGLWTNFLLRHDCTILEDKLINYRSHKNQITGRYQTTKILMQTIFEYRRIFNIIYENIDIFAFNKIFNANLKKENEKYLKFLFCRECLKDKHQSISFAALDKIIELFEDDKTRQEIYEKFNFGVKDVRQLSQEVFIYNSLNSHHDRKKPKYKKIFRLIKNYIKRKIKN